MQFVLFQQEKEAKELKIKTSLIFCKRYLLPD